MAQDVVVINNVTAVLGTILLMIIFGALLYAVVWPRVCKDWRSKKKRRKAHLQYVSATNTELRYKIINVALAYERGDISEKAFLRRSYNAAKLIRRYEVKRAQLNRFIG